MKKITLIKSIKELAALKAEELCSKDKPYFQTFVAAMEKKVIDDHIHGAILEENVKIVNPILRALVKDGTIWPIPVPFEKYGEQCTHLRMGPYNVQVSSDNEKWYYLNDEEEVHLFEALDSAGCLDSIE